MGTESTIRDRCSSQAYDAIVVGSGPNGLAAAITLLRHGRSVLVLEASASIGGGLRSDELTLPNFIHDICSAIHPLALASPFFQTLDWSALGVEWLQPEIQFGHPFASGGAGRVFRSVAKTADDLGRDGQAYKQLMDPLTLRWKEIVSDVLAPAHFPRHPLATARFARVGLRSVESLVQNVFASERPRAIFGGAAAHSELPLNFPTTSGVGLLLTLLAHAVGWPLPRGGSQTIADALGRHILALGGEILTHARVKSLEDLPATRDVLCDTGPAQLLALAGDRLSGSYRRQLSRFRYGPGVFKIDYALDGPMPWKEESLLKAGTVHVGGSFNEIANAESIVQAGGHPDRPYLLVAQQSLFDSSRAPKGKHTLWAYCHVPNGSTVDMVGPIERQLERFAPNFRDRILKKSSMSPAHYESHNANYVGGDINGGKMDVRQLFFRPAVRLNPYSTPLPGLYICSSSTPPGGGVHGMCGYWAALSVLGRAARRMHPQMQI